MSKESFIKFAKANPSLINSVRRGDVSWQNLYETYSIYGENKSVWNKYLNNKDSSVNELVNLIKTVNLESIRKVVDGLQKTITLVQDIGKDKIKEDVYESTPMYEDFDD